MSRMGNYNLQLQEQAEEMGFSTVQEALDNGYHVIQDLVDDEWKLERIDLMQEQEKAHEAWEKEKEEVIKGLKWVLEGYEFADGDERDIERAIKFIEGVKYE